MRRFIPGMLVVVGCGGGGNAVPQLEAIEIGGIEEGVSARFSVTGSGRDYQLTSEDGEVEVVVHTPTGADLTVFDGVSLTLDGRADASDDRGTTWRATDGAPLWLAYRGSGEAPVDEWFGAGFAGLGAVLGEERISKEQVLRRYHTAVFQTDTGPVELTPGEVDTLVIDGVQWRVGVVAAYQDNPTSNVKCVFFPTLAYELLRVDTPVAPESVDPIPDLAITGSTGCG